MDSYEGAPDDPPSLHKYLYCQANPINHLDPSGHDLGSTMATMAINSIVGGLAISAISRGYDAAMQFRAGMDLGSIAEDAALGMGEDALINVATLGLGKISAIRRAGQAVKRAAGSVWNLGWGLRGKHIEGLVAKVLGKSELMIGKVRLSEVPGFPVIDDFTEGVARSVKSIDLTGKTYQDAAALTKTLSGYAHKLC